MNSSGAGDSIEAQHPKLEVSKGMDMEVAALSILSGQPLACVGGGGWDVTAFAFFLGEDLACPERGR